MDSDMLSKIGRGFWDGGIFGALEAAFAPQPSQQARTRPAAPANTRELVIDDSGCEGFEIDRFWLDYFSCVQPITMARPNPTLRDLVCDTIEYQLRFDDDSGAVVKELKEICDVIVKELGVPSPYHVFVKMNMTVQRQIEPSYQVQLTDDEARLLRTSAAYLSGCETAGRPPVLGEPKLDFLPREERNRSMMRLSLAMPSGAGTLSVSGEGLQGLGMTMGAMVMHRVYRIDGPLGKCGEEMPPSYCNNIPLVGLDRFISRDPADVEILFDLTDKILDKWPKELDDEYEIWRRNRLPSYYTLMPERLPSPIEPWREQIRFAAQGLKGRFGGDLALTDFTEAVIEKNHLDKTEADRFLDEVAAGIMNYMGQDPEDVRLLVAL